MGRLFLSLFCGLLIFIAHHSSAENIVGTTNKTQILIAAAIAQTHNNVTYNGAYFKITYPMGDVPAQYGVCTDVIIRAYRKLGIDLQQLVHEDMRGNSRSLGLEAARSQYRSSPRSQSANFFLPSRKKINCI